ncbi:Glyoxalase/Bleomycin resistance protein/Dioxygenase superfamily protein [uncultured archaeon]|nr:Glyoxalase/Bleomycin resistance protein/Dioxygenase superfamily protein [uncultured archaeon]
MHFHIPVDDMARAKKFYKNIFGWEIKETGMGMDFQLVTTTPTDEEGMPLEPGGINGGLYKRERPEQTQSVVINVPSIDDYLKKIEKAGGKVIQQKMPVEDFGFYAMIADTEGNVIGLWEDVE